MNTRAFGLLSAFVTAGTTVFAQMGGGQGGQGGMNRSYGWMNGGGWLWPVIGVLGGGAAGRLDQQGLQEVVVRSGDDGTVTHE